MPRFFFHIHDASGIIKDDNGSEFENLSEAHREAIKLARCAVADLSEVGDVVDGQAIEVCDASGSVLEVVPLRDPGL